MKDKKCGGCIWYRKAWLAELDKSGSCPINKIRLSNGKYANKPVDMNDPSCNYYEAVDEGAVNNAD